MVNYDFTKESPLFTANDNEISNNIEQIKPKILLFQSGYLTIKDIIPVSHDSYKFIQGIPNSEVAKAIVPFLLDAPQPEDFLVSKALSVQTRKSLLSLNMEEFMKSFGQFLSIIPYADHLPDENFYRSIFNFCMALANLEVESQKQTSHGIIDIHINGSKDDDYILGFKYFSEKSQKIKRIPLRQQNLSR